eukprot:CAMPEP_0206183004 /NCGR_PEP_ID=MMETSP0166-20121206/387_1 /ASSEMBLY_ACC=CAM_ASM_000260 /TAXON_ID=95228 /ORGANISM="Vannella robusta, Strain DIVA3 518/3/11/1/6" /LENGTH=332 /DNA_ID=CAMNT_0053597791 /DNA_START=320 /DNA_END=1318 /DNA_ORIENTATION=-
MADPVSRLFFRYSGMYEGGKFDRSSSKKLMTLKKAIVKLPSVGDVSRHLIPVPLCVNEQNWDIGTLYMTPPFIKRKKKKKSRKQRKEAKKEEAESGHDVGLGPTSAIVSPKSDVVGPVNSELGSINVFVYKPKEMDENETLPVVIWYHGGGFCVGSIEDSMYERICRTFCNRIRCIVVSVEYRLAPEFKFPTPLEDCYWALLWVYHLGSRLFNADISRIVVAGDSAGGSLSALMCIMSNLRSGPKICHQVLIYPCLANPCNDDYESQVTYRQGPLLTRKVMKWFMCQCLGDSSAEPEGMFPLLMPDSLIKNDPPQSSTRNMIPCSTMAGNIF